MLFLAFTDLKKNKLTTNTLNLQCQHADKVDKWVMFYIWKGTILGLPPPTKQSILSISLYVT